MGRQAQEEARGVSPRAFALELTKGCNLRCGYCYYAGRDDAYDPRTRMSEEVALQSVERLLADGSAEAQVHLHFFGGEPLLNFPLLRKTVEYGNRRAREEGRRITYEVTTNGTRFTEEIISFLNEHSVHVGVSFDGPPDVQDVSRPAASGSSHAQAEPGIRALVASRRGTDLEAKTHCSVVVTNRCSNLVRISDHLEELGFQKIILTPATDLEGESHGFRDEDLPEVLAAYDELADRYEDTIAAGRHVAPTWFPTLMGRLLSGERKMTFCDGGRDYLGVAADGDVHLCYRFFEDDDFRMGSVQEGIDRGVTDRLIENELDTRTTCSKCWARYFCGGGCHHENVTDGGGLGEPNPVSCDIFRHSMGRTLDAWARLSRAGHLDGRKSPKMTERDPKPGGATSPRVFAQDERPRQAPGCHTRDLDGEKVVYDPVSHEVVVLNGTAAFLFELCDGERTVSDILDAFAERFDAPRDVLARDLGATLTDLAGKELLR